MSAVLKPAPLAIVLMAIDQIRPSPSSPRKNFKDVDDLADNIKTHGIKVPLRVRPVDQHHELVFGERRWRAAKKAGLKEVPVIVEAMTDAAALELMLVELAQTADVHPVEEAEAYRELHIKHKLSVDEIAAKVGKSKSHVYGRMKLAELAEPVRKAALAGDLPATHALLIARIPTVKLQEEALKAFKRNAMYSEPVVSYREAASIVQREFMLQLSEAQWDKADEKLVPNAGSCVKCPKRTGNQPELFADVEAKDTCTDPSCFASKKEAFVKLTIEKAKADGKKVLEQEEAKKYFGYQAGRDGAAMIDLDERDYRDPKNRTWREKLGKKAPAAVVAVDDAAKVHELVPRKEVEKALPKREAPAKKPVSMETQQKHKMELRGAVVKAAVPLLLAAAKKQHERVLRAMLDRAVTDADHAEFDVIAMALGLDPENPIAAEKALLAKAIGPDLPALLYAFAVLPGAEGWTYSIGYGAEFSEACKLLKIDLKKLEGAERLKRKAAEKAKKIGKKGMASYRPEEQCAVPGCGQPKEKSGFCSEHERKLSESERKSILARNVKLAVEGKLPTPAKKKAKKK